MLFNCHVDFLNDFGVSLYAAMYSEMCADSIRLLPKFRIADGCPSIPKGFNSSAGERGDDDGYPVGPDPTPRDAPVPTPPTPATRSIPTGSLNPLLSRAQRRWIILAAVVVVGLVVHLCVRASVAAPTRHPADDIEATVEVQEAYLAAVEKKKLAKALDESLRNTGDLSPA